MATLPVRGSFPWIISRKCVNKVKTTKNLISIFVIFSHCRARRRKKIAKALERQARKLRAKGIAVDLEALKAEYLSQHRNNSGSDSEDDEDNDEDEDPIDVVGGAESGDEPEDCSMQRRESVDDVLDESSDTPRHNSIRPNPFSIESLLYNNT